jgi:hypothetical protein
MDKRKERWYAAMRCFLVLGILLLLFVSLAVNIAASSVTIVCKCKATNSAFYVRSGDVPEADVSSWLQLADQLKKAGWECKVWYHSDYEVAMNVGGILFRDSGCIEPSASASHITIIEHDTSVASFHLAWRGSNLDLILHSPDGTTIDPSSNISTVYYVEEATHEYYVIQNPEPGTWSMEVRSVDVPSSGEDYFVFIALPVKKIGAVFNGHYADYGTDVDGDKLYEFLTLEVGVDVQTLGEYSLMGSLYDLDGSEVVWSVDHRVLSPGNHTMYLDFDGKTIESYGVNGPYHIKDIVLLSGSSDTNFTLCDVVPGSYTTTAYNYSDFVDPVRSEKVISGNGSGGLALTVTIRDTAPVYSGRYSYDIVGINVPPISTPWNRTTPGYGYEFPGVSIPGKPNNYTVTAEGVENLNIGLKQLRGNHSRIWITTRIDAAEDGRATTETDLISPGSYHVKIFGDAAENVSQVDLTMTLVKNIVVNGKFNLSIDTTGFPSGDYSIALKALNGPFRLDEITLEGLPLAP